MSIIKGSKHNLTIVHSAGAGVVGEMVRLGFDPLIIDINKVCQMQNNLRQFGRTVVIFIYFS